MDPSKHSQLIFDKSAKAIQLRRDSLLTSGTETSRHPHVK